jgi:hypothetical protein
MKTKIIVGAFVLIGLASIAYAAFAQVLNISGTGTSSGDWSVKITSITQTSATGVTENSAPSFTDTSANFDVNLAYPGATATYKVTVTNAGTIPAVLTSVDGVTAANAAAPAYITYDLTGVNNGTTLAANGGTNIANVTVTWDPASAPVSSGETKTATITLNYAQDT